MRRTFSLAILFALIAAAPATADTIRVHNGHDHGAGSLRKALEVANDGDTIKVPAVHIELTSGQLLVEDAVKITGDGARHTIVDANGNSRVFEINTGLTKVTMSGLTVREGHPVDAQGGGFLVGSDLVLVKVAALENQVDTVTFHDGGALYAQSSAIITARQSLFAHNKAYNGGAYNGDSNSEIHATDSTFANNAGGNPNSNGDAGAIFGSAILIDSTVAGNRCFFDSGCGGAFYSDDLTLKGTIVADNYAYLDNGKRAGSPGNPGVKDNCAYLPPTSLGHNLDDTHDCFLTEPSDISGKDPKLGALRNNGGPTDTMAVGTGSPAFNAGAKQCTKRDQRGVRRPQGNRCDIGAFELER